MIDYIEKETILQADKINLKFGEKVVLRDVSFIIRDIVRTGVSQGQVICLPGRSGIGKTQLIKILAGLIPPTSGEIKIGIAQNQVRAGDVGIIPQNYILFNHRTILKNLRLAVDRSGKNLSEKEKTELINNFAAEFDLTDHLNKFPMQLSGGQRQRASIVQQILTGNKFILMDEPTSGLDPIMKDKVIKLILKISLLDELNTLIIVSHDIVSAMAISDLVLVLAKEENKEGATIIEQIDLKKEGLAWRSDIHRDPAFQERVEYVKRII